MGKVASQYAGSSLTRVTPDTRYGLFRDTRATDGAL